MNDTAKTEALPPLPEWEACARKNYRMDAMTALERFIYDNEPADNPFKIDEWRASVELILSQAIAQDRASRGGGAADGWQSIESAPQDGTPIILGYFGGHSEEGYWMGEPTRNHWGEIGWFDVSADVLCEHPCRPDVWQHLPAAPAVSAVPSVATGEQSDLGSLDQLP